MHLQAVCDYFQLKRIKKFPISLPESAAKYGNIRRFRGLEVYYLLADVGRYLVVLVGSKELPTKDTDQICGLALQRNAENWSQFVSFDGGLLMVKAVVAKETAVSVEIFDQLVGEIRAIHRHLGETVNVFPLPFPQAINSYFPAPAFRHNHTFHSSFTEETYEVSLAAYQRNEAICIYSALCPVEAAGLEKTRRFLAACNEELVPGAFKLRKGEVVFEMWVVNSEVCSELTVQAYCDLVAKYTHCYQGPFTSIASPSPPTLRKALMLCKYSLEHLD